MFDNFIKTLRTNLLKPLPGNTVQFEMAHVNRERIENTYSNLIDYRQSAVLILLYPNNQNTTCVLLIERSTYNGHHSGQIALPGGKAELNDKDLEETALREFFEETGSESKPKVIGKLTPVYIPVSKFMVQPFVAYINHPPNFSPNTFEVNELIEWEIQDLLNPANVKETIIEPQAGIKIKTPYFDVNGKVLWGATAMMLNELKAIAS